MKTQYLKDIFSPTPRLIYWLLTIVAIVIFDFSSNWLVEQINVDMSAGFFARLAEGLGSLFYLVLLLIWTMLAVGLIVFFLFQMEIDDTIEIDSIYGITSLVAIGVATIYTLYIFYSTGHSYFYAKDSYIYFYIFNLVLLIPYLVEIYNKRAYYNRLIEDENAEIEIERIKAIEKDEEAKRLEEIQSIKNSLVEAIISENVENTKNALVKAKEYVNTPLSFSGAMEKLPLIYAFENKLSPDILQNLCENGARSSGINRRTISEYLTKESFQLLSKYNKNLFYDAFRDNITYGKDPIYFQNIKSLVECGFDVKKQGNELLKLAIKNNNIKVIELLLANNVNLNGISLVEIMENGSTEVVELLLENGINPDS